MDNSKYLIIIGLVLGLVACDKEPDPKPEPQIAKPIIPSDAHVQAGQAIHDQNCISCHDSSIYSRPERRIANYSELLAQVRRCNGNLAERLYDEELQEIALYLNKTYYSLKQP
jgi:mono/diheme cytochrome c family protein